MQERGSGEGGAGEGRGQEKGEKEVENQEIIRRRKGGEGGGRGGGGDVVVVEEEEEEEGEWTKIRAVVSSFTREKTSRTLTKQMANNDNKSGNRMESKPMSKGK